MLSVGKSSFCSATTALSAASRALSSLATTALALTSSCAADVYSAVDIHIDNMYDVTGRAARLVCCCSESKD